MAKRSNYVNKSKRIDVLESEEEQAVFGGLSEDITAGFSNEPPETVQLVLLRNLKLKYTGPVTEKLYVFDGGGSVLPIDVEDAEIMLAKRGGQCCPGGSGPQPYFAKEG